MDEKTIRKLDINSLLTRKVRTETIEEEVLVNPTSASKIDMTPNRSLSLGSEVIDAEVSGIDEVTENFGNPHLPSSIKKTEIQEATINEILDKYNKKYNLDLHYGTLQDAMEIAVAGDKAKNELMTAVVGNSILQLVDFTNFSLIVLACKQINGLVSEMLEGDNLGSEDKIVLLDRIFLWINRLQGLKSLYSPSDIEHIVKKIESNKMRSGNNSSVAITKILEILKLGKKEE